VARAAGAGSAFLDRLDHRLAHERMLAHAEIIVRAPDHDLANTAIPLMQAGQRKAPGLAFEIGKESIASFGFELSDLSAEKRIEIHAALPEKAEVASILREHLVRGCGSPPQPLRTGASMPL